MIHAVMYRLEMERKKRITFIYQMFLYWETSDCDITCCILFIKAWAKLTVTHSSSILKAAARNSSCVDTPSPVRKDLDLALACIWNKDTTTIFLSHSYLQDT